MYDKELIKELTPMRTVAEYYGGELRHNRMPCPFHGGKDYNLAVYNSGYHCFVCGASGDQFSFVEKLFNCDFQSACKRLIDDFNLPVKDSSYMSDAERLKMAQERDKRLKRLIVRRMNRYAQEWKYGVLVGKYIDAEKASRNGEPTPWSEPTKEWSDAITDKEYYEYALEEMGYGVP